MVVYGHKSPLMLVCFIAAAKAGLTYAPVDIAYPSDRVNDILDQIGHPLVITLSDDEFARRRIAGRFSRRRCRCSRGGPGGRSWDSSRWIADETPFYLLFTSGSTGRPKGVHDALALRGRLMDYFAHFSRAARRRQLQPRALHLRCEPVRHYRRFGLGLYPVLLESEDEQSMRATFGALAASDLTTWISTPSFIEMCLVDPSFDQDLLPRLDNVILCGEVFRNATALKITNVFPEARVLNTTAPPRLRRSPILW